MPQLWKKISVRKKSDWTAVLQPGDGGRSSVVRALEFKSKTLGSIPWWGRVQGSFSIPLSQLLCRLVCAWPPFACMACTQICAHVIVKVLFLYYCKTSPLEKINNEVKSECAICTVRLQCCQYHILRSSTTTFTFDDLLHNTPEPNSIHLHYNKSLTSCEANMHSK